MILINKEEAEAVRSKYPDTKITRTCKQKSKRHRYFCEESRGAMRIINNLRRAKGGR